MTVKKTQQTLGTTLEKTEQSLNGLEAALESSVGGGLRATGEHGIANREKNGLPEGWLETTIEKISSDVSYGYTAKSSSDKIGPHMLRITDIQDGQVNWNNVPYCSIIDSKLEKYLLEKGDLLFARTGATVGKSFLIREEPPESVYASYLIRVRTLDKSGTEYLAHFFNSPNYWNQILDFSAGIGQPNVNGTKLKELEIPLPPLAEQTVIAQTLDTLLAQVDNIKTRLDAIPNILKTFRQSVLAAAVSGKLTEAWREENECGEWIELTLNDVAIFQNGFAFKSDWFQSEGKYQVLKLGNIRDRKLLLENAAAFVTEEVAQEHIKFKVKADDSLISMTGTRHKMDYGFVSFIDTSMNLLINQRVGRLSPVKEKVSGLYLNTFLRSEIFRKQFFKGETGGVNQGNVGTKHILSCSIELPPIEEQTQIVHRVEELFAFADQIEQQVKNAQGRVNNLTQSILAKAFRGELTTQWRAENPDLISGENSAEALLAKIQAERDALKKKAKPKKATKKKSTAKK